MLRAAHGLARLPAQPCQARPLHQARFVSLADMLVSSTYFPRHCDMTGSNSSVPFTQSSTPPGVPRAGGCHFERVSADKLKTHGIPDAAPHRFISRHNGYPLFRAPRARDGRHAPAGLLARGSNVPSSLPDKGFYGSRGQWRMWRELAAYSCGGSPGVARLLARTGFPFSPGWLAPPRNRHGPNVVRSAARRQARQMRLLRRRDSAGSRRLSVRSTTTWRPAPTNRAEWRDRAR